VLRPVETDGFEIGQVEVAAVPARRRLERDRVGLPALALGRREAGIRRAVAVRLKQIQKLTYNYNASVVKIYSGVNSMARFKIIFFLKAI
jgi:hypothetical protein